MADNIGYTPGVGATVAADEIGGLLYQRVKVSVGADNEAADLDSGQATMANSLPVTIASDQSDLPITLDGEVVTVAGEQENAAVSGDPLLIGGRYDITPRVLGSGDAGALAINAAGNLLVDIGANVVSVDATGQGDVPITLAGETVVADVTGFGDVPVAISGTVPVSNAGTFATQATQAGTWTVDLGITDNAVLDAIQTNTLNTANSVGGTLVVNATSSGDVPITLAGEAVTIAGTVPVSIASTINTNAIQSGTWNVNLGATDNAVLDSIATNTSNTYTSVINTQPRNNVASDTGGCSTYRDLDLDETSSAPQVSGTACTLYGFWVTNSNDATLWIKFYDATSATVGTTTPKITFGIPGNTSQDISGNLGGGPTGIAFANGMCVAATTGVADADTGAPDANDIVINIFYE